MGSQRGSISSALPVFALLLLLDAGPAIAAPVTEAETLFDGRSLAGWAQSRFEGDGRVRVVPSFREGPGAIIIESGTTLSGFRWARDEPPPRTNYELSLEAMRLEGGDFFCGLTFPVGEAACTFIVGGWGGMVVGLSSIDGLDASENETTDGLHLEDERWYRIRVRVTEEKIEAWIDNRQQVDVTRAGRTFGLRPGEIHKSLPLGVATYLTRAAIRNIQLRRL